MTDGAAGFALVSFEPLDAALDLFVVLGDAGLAEDVDDKAGGVAIARAFGIVGRAVEPLPITERGQIPAAVVPLQSQQFLNGLLLLCRGHQTI